MHLHEEVVVDFDLPRIFSLASCGRRLPPQLSGRFSASTDWGVLAPLSSRCCSWTASLCRIVFLAFSSVRSASIWRRSDRVLSLVPTTNLSQTVGFRTRS